jgi:hypothetical protein
MQGRACLGLHTQGAEERGQHQRLRVQPLCLRLCRQLARFLRLDVRDKELFLPAQAALKL